MHEFDNMVMLNDEYGNEINFEFLDLIQYKGEEYVVLLPLEKSDETGEVVILKIEDIKNENEESYASVENEDILNAVFDIFKQKLKDKFGFVD